MLPVMLGVLCRQEISQLAMQLKAANMSSKGGDKARQGMAKDIEKVQKKLADTESKLRNISDEKLQLTSEKAAQERKVKVAEAQVSKLTKELEKKDGACSRKISGVQEVRYLPCVIDWIHPPFILLNHEGLSPQSCICSMHDGPEPLQPHHCSCSCVPCVCTCVMLMH